MSDYGPGETRMVDEESIREWNEWVGTRPPPVRAVAEKLEPWLVYRIKETGHRCRIYSIGEPNDPSEPATVTVSVTNDRNPQGLVFERNVFGLGLDDIEAERPGAQS